MRIGIDLFLYNPQSGGIAHYIRTLLELWPQVHPGDRLTLFVSGRSGADLPAFPGESPGHIERVELNAHADIGERPFTDHIDLLFAPLGVLVRRPFPKPSVVLLADLQERFYPEFFCPADLTSRLEHHTASLHAASVALAISEFTRQSFIRLAGLPEPRARRVHLCPQLFAPGPSAAPAPGADTAPAPKEGAAPVPVPPAEPGADAATVAEAPPDATPSYAADPPPPDLTAALDPGRFPPQGFALYPAQFWPHKNHAALLEALDLLRQHPREPLDIPCIFTGDLLGRDAEWQALRQRHNGTTATAHIGRVSPEALAWLYRNARLLVFPSLFEGFGIPVVEALAQGLPVVCSDCASLPEAAGPAGIYCNPGSPRSIARAVRGAWTLKPAQRRQLAKAGRRQAQFFTPQRLLDDHRAAFAAALGEPVAVISAEAADGAATEAPVGKGTPAPALTPRERAAARRLLAASRLPRTPVWRLRQALCRLLWSFGG